MNEKKQWGTKLGFILATAGSAIGLGNLWKFPYLMGSNGGFWFLIAYLLFVCVLGIPVMMLEMSLGRKTRSNPIHAYGQTAKGARIVGVMGVLSAYIILSYYSVIGGWIVKYMTNYITTFAAPASFDMFISGTAQPIIYHFIFMLASAIICLRGVAGIEKASKIMMPTLFVILIIVMIRSVTLPGALEGLSFMFTPRSSEFSLNSISAALGQVFYSLSLCMGITITYGSYLRREENIPKSCITVAGLDTALAVFAGIAIFPAVFTFGMEPGQGPGLIFGTLPQIFEQLTGGTIFAILFFILVLFAALTSSISLLEAVASFVMDKWKMSRTKAVILIAITAFVIGIPSSLSFGSLSGMTLFGYTFFDLVGMLADNFLLPIGGLLMCYFIGWKWKPQLLVEEIESEGVSFKWSKIWLISIRVITPILIAIVTIAGFIGIYQSIVG